jgi:hypothetical protein
MIVRILGEGQLDVPESELDGLNDLDEELQSAVEAADEERFTAALGTLLEKVRSTGKPVPVDELVSSKLILPNADASLAEVRDLLSGDGLIPG